MVFDGVTETFILPKGPAQLKQSPTLSDTAPVSQAFLDRHKPKQQPTHTDSQRESLFFDYRDASLRWLEPDLSALGLRKQEKIGKGFAFDVYQAQEVGGKNMVVKVEKVAMAVDPDDGKEKPHYPWQALSIGVGERAGLHTTEDASQRREVHFRIRDRLQQKGIETANYFGSLVINSLPQTPELVTRQPVKAESTNATMLNLIEGERPPMYAELWENPGGKMMGKDEAKLEAMYASAEGRAKLRKLATGLIDLAKDGFVYDVGQDIGRIDGLHSPKTKNGLPYARNFFMTESEAGIPGKMVAIDFNMGIDLTKEAWWDPDILAGDVTIISPSNGRMYLNYAITNALYERAGAMVGKYQDKADVWESYKKAMGEEHMIIQSQQNHLLGQLYTAVSILQEIQKREVPARKT